MMKSFERAESGLSRQTVAIPVANLFKQLLPRCIAFYFRACAHSKNSGAHMVVSVLGAQNLSSSQQ